VSSQYATAEVGCMPSTSDPHRSQLIGPYNHRQLEYAMSLANSQAGANAIWVGCDDSDGDGAWTDRY
jgi:hypothetical protein